MSLKGGKKKEICKKREQIEQGLSLVFPPPTRSPGEGMQQGWRWLLRRTAWGRWLRLLLRSLLGIPWPGVGPEQRSALSLRQRPCFSQNSRAIYVPRCPNEEWTPLFLSSGWYFNGRLTGNRSKGAICLFFSPLKRLQKCTLAFGFCSGLKGGTSQRPHRGAGAQGPLKAQGLETETSPSQHFLLPLSLLQGCWDLTGMPETRRPDSTQVRVDAIPTEVNKSGSHPTLSQFSAVPAPNPREGRWSSLYPEHSRGVPDQEVLNLFFELLLCTAIRDCKAGDEGHGRAINPAGGALPAGARAAEQPSRPAERWAGTGLTYCHCPDYRFEWFKLATSEAERRLRPSGAFFIIPASLSQGIPGTDAEGGAGMLSTLQTPNPLVFETKAMAFHHLSLQTPAAAPFETRPAWGWAAGSVGQGGGKAGSGQGWFLARATPIF